MRYARERVPRQRRPSHDADKGPHHHHRGGKRGRQAEAPGEVKAEQLLVSDLAGEPDKEVNIQVYTFPPGASVPWHIHPDAHEFDYELDGTLTLQTDGEGSKVLKRGDA